MTRKEILTIITTRSGLPRKRAKKAVDIFFLALRDAIVDGERIEIRGFGTFKVKERKARTARNPRTGEPVPLPARRVPVFKVSKELKNRINQKNEDGS